MPELPVVAVLGTGRMGSAMVRRLASRGHRLRLWNRTEGSARALALSLPQQAEVLPTAGEAVRGVDVVLTMLSDGEVTLGVLSAPDLLAALAPTTVVVNLATCGGDEAGRLETVYRDSGRRLVDAPVSGSVATIESGTLLVMASGDARDIDVVRPVLAAFAGDVLQVGTGGARAQAMKLALNLVLLGLNSLLSEALVLAERSGIEPSSAYDVIEASVVSSPFVRYKRVAFLDDDAPVALTLDLAAKDLRLISELAGLVSLRLTVADAVRDQLEDAVDHDFARRDMARLRDHVALRSSA